MNGVAAAEFITIKNATVNNLKNVNVNLPIEKLICVTGPSGCGKSSLIYDTLYSESQRSFLECLSGNMFGQKLMDKPQVESIENLRPALKVSQTYYNYNPRSTVGTLTDISHYLRTLYALIINYENKSNLKDNYFSSNNPDSCCPYCSGLGEEYQVSLDLLIPDKEKTLSSGAILWYKGKETSKEFRLLEEICKKYNIDINSKFSELNNHQLEILLYKKEADSFQIKFKTPKGRYKQYTISSCGAVTEIAKLLKHKDVPSTFSSISKYLVKEKCRRCNGSKLNEKVLNKKILDYNIAETEKLKLVDLISWINDVNTNYKDSLIADQISQLTYQILKRTSSIIKLNVGYLSLSRSVPTLSGGEIQRLRIANQLNCSLIGLVYILDEPCKGLHPKNVNSVINASRVLVERHNTVISIEHNKEYISASDYIVEMGPCGGPNGGYILSQKKPCMDINNGIKFNVREKFKNYVTVIGINFRNIINQSVKFPVGGITCITGISGCGKSTLASVLEQSFDKKRNILCDKINGLSYIKDVEKVDQQPIGKTPRSTVISYLGIYDDIRDIFAKSCQARDMKLTPSDFSMNVSGGRCECCQGSGVEKIELSYLPDSFVTCRECHGKRFNDNVLSVRYNQLSISDVLNYPISEIIDKFKDNINIYEKLQCMVKLGLDYIKLGQMSMNLSGGEAQRIKLAKILGKKNSGKTLFILDEPTSGLNYKDIDKFVSIIKQIKEKGNTILIIEHNTKFVAENSDYVIDFGCNAGNKGGVIKAMGHPEDVFANKLSSWYGMI